MTRKKLTEFTKAGPIEFRNMYVRLECIIPMDNPVDFHSSIESALDSLCCEGLAVVTEVYEIVDDQALAEQLIQSRRLAGDTSGEEWCD